MTLERVWIGLTAIEEAWRRGDFGYLPNGDPTPTPDRSGEADKTGTGLAEGESGLPEGSSKP